MGDGQIFFNSLHPRQESVTFQVSRTASAIQILSERLWTTLTKILLQRKSIILKHRYQDIQTEKLRIVNACFFNAHNKTQQQGGLIAAAVL